MVDDSQLSITRMFAELKAGNSPAANDLWKVYAQALVAEARKKLRHADRRVSDEEDVALSVFLKLCDGAQDGRFDEVKNRTDLWRLLVSITRQKAADHTRRQNRQKRGGGTVRGDSVFLDQERNVTERVRQQIVSHEPPPEFLVALEEEYCRLLDALENESLKTVAKMRIEGYSNEEIAERMDLSVRSVERKLKLVRERWSRELGLDFSNRPFPAE